MSDIYRQHDAAFSSVSAFVVMNGATKVATIAFKFPRDGAGRLYCYLQWAGLPMVRGFAGGGGYDKKTAAASQAARKLVMGADRYADGTPCHSDAEKALYDRFKAALMLDGGASWDKVLADAGFTVWQAV